MGDPRPERAAVSDEFRALLVMVCAANPAAFALAARGHLGDLRIAGTTAVTAGLLAVLAAASSASLLDFLDTTEASFQLAAGVVILGVGLTGLIWPGGSRTFTGTWRDGLFPLGFPLAFNPAIAVGAIHYGASDGVGTGIALTLVAILAAVGAAWFLGVRWRAALEAVARLTAAILIVLAVGLVVDSIKSV